jgi:hypothetical protein
MHLVSRQDQAVTVAGVPFKIRKGESIRTECSHKYTLDEFGEMVARAGFTVKRVWTDEHDLFSVQYCERDGPTGSDLAKLLILLDDGCLAVKTITYRGPTRRGKNNNLPRSDPEGYLGT